MNDLFLNTLDGFTKQALADPGNVDLRLVIADFFEENGRPDVAECYREEEPSLADLEPDRDADYRRGWLSLVLQHPCLSSIVTSGSTPLIVAVPTNDDDLYWANGYIPLQGKWYFGIRHGMIERVCCSADWWFKAGMALLDHHPISWLTFCDVHPGDFIISNETAIELVPRELFLIEPTGYHLMLSAELRGRGFDMTNGILFSSPSEAAREFSEAAMRISHTITSTEDREPLRHRLLDEARLRGIDPNTIRLY
jgi:uncharacterized protein (TIGR02996 family)